ncbi:MAG: hypothetical protein AB1664_12200, partial [Thermodesulfobacteriota bacterium]
KGCFDLRLPTQCDITTQSRIALNSGWACSIVSQIMNTLALRASSQCSWCTGCLARQPVRLIPGCKAKKLQAGSEKERIPISFGEV